jgi:hypothetical protein
MNDVETGGAGRFHFRTAFGTYCLLPISNGSRWSCATCWATEAGANSPNSSAAQSRKHRWNPKKRPGSD